MAADAASATEGVARGPRHPAGTWTIWESLWFYATKVEGYTDMKIWIRAPLRQPPPAGMGTRSMSRTLTPHRYGDTWSDPWRTLLLLRAWALWRAGWHGWIGGHPGRSREHAKERSAFEADLRAAHGDGPGPLLGSPLADDLLRQWAPQVHQRVAG